MPDQTPLNPDGLAASNEAVRDLLNKPGRVTDDMIAHTAVSAYLSVAPPAVNSAEELEALPVGSVIADLYDDRGDAPVVLCKALNRDWAALTTGTQNGRQWWTSEEIAHVARRLRVLHRPEVDA